MPSWSTKTSSSPASKLLETFAVAPSSSVSSGSLTVRRLSTGVPAAPSVYAVGPADVVTTGGLVAPWTVTVAVAKPESASPSLALYLKVSVAVSPGARLANCPFGS